MQHAGTYPGAPPMATSTGIRAEVACVSSARARRDFSNAGVATITIAAACVMALNRAGDPVATPFTSL